MLDGCECEELDIVIGVSMKGVNPSVPVYQHNRLVMMETGDGRDEGQVIVETDVLFWWCKRIMGGSGLLLGGLRQRAKVGSRSNREKGRDARHLLTLNLIRASLRLDVCG